MNCVNIQHEAFMYTVSIGRAIYMIIPAHQAYTYLVGSCTSQGRKCVLFLFLLNLNIFYCLNNDKRIRHKFFNLVLSSPYTYNIQYTIWYALLLHNFSKQFNMKTWKNKCSNKAECDNGISLKVTNQTDPSIKKLGHRE